MNNPQGRVRSLNGDAAARRAVVGIDVQAACPRCAAGKGCGAGIFSGTDREREVEAAVRPGLAVAEGDLVEVTLAPDNLLRAALIVYGLPMAGAVLGALLAYALKLADAAAALAALVGLCTGLVLGRRRLRRAACLEQFVPTVARRIADGR